ncbi:MAG: OmpA family protein [Rickettsiales bacterium]|nr:OmpA family protein [Rickettsiales bacterium]
MSKRGHKKEAHEDESWLLTYADFITLLMCFFIIILSMSEPKQADVELLQDALEEFNKNTVDKPKPFNQLFDKLQMAIAELQAEEAISIEKTNRGVLLELSASSFYDSGSANFRPEAIPVLEKMAEVLANFDYEDYLVQIDGHTDDSPMQSSLFASNWELSAVRATTVVRFLIEHGMEKDKMRASGFADILPKVPNIDEFGNAIEENRELNRRVVIKIERKLD